jgi:hypothetical protein
MKSAFRGLVAGAVLAFGLASVASAAAPDPIIGTWKMNAAKSTFKSGTAFTTQTRTYAQSDKGITVTIKGMAGGKETSMTATYMFDGKEYPVMGNPDWDTLTGKQVDANKAEFTFKKGGKVVGTSSRTVSKDGKTMTAESNYTDAKGGKVESTISFDRQ